MRRVHQAFNATGLSYAVSRPVPLTALMPGCPVYPPDSAHAVGASAYPRQVALGIETHRAFHSHDEIVRLVEAVIAANSEDESTWIEWKGPLDLRKEAAFHRLPRNVLGFANRDPAAAAHHAEGYGYLIIGAEPGEVPGVDPIDPGDLSARVRAYIGDKIAWRPEYVTVQGKQVLVITVDPPRAGDSIHPLRKPMQAIQAGEIFIRLAGQTVKAHAEHIEMLERRCKASNNLLSITVSPRDEARIERPADLGPLIELRVSQMRERLLAAAPKPPETSWGSGRIRLGPEFAGRAQADHAKHTSTYIEDIEVYLNEWARAVRLRGDLIQSQHAPSALTLKVTNNTDRNYSALQVSALVPGVQAALDPEGRRWPDLPEEPQPPRMVPEPDRLLPGLLGLQGLNRIPSPYPTVTDALATSMLTPAGFPRSLRKVQTPTGLLLKYPDMNLRPHQDVLLESVPLLVPGEVGSPLLIRWDATAHNADGKLSGQIAMTLHLSTMTAIPLPEEFWQR